MAKATRVHVRERRGTLLFDFIWFPDAQLPEKSSYVDFTQKKIFIGQGWVRGKETHLKTSGSYREIDMLSTV